MAKKRNLSAPETKEIEMAREALAEHFDVHVEDVSIDSKGNVEIKGKKAKGKVLVEHCDNPDHDHNKEDSSERRKSRSKRHTSIEMSVVPKEQVIELVDTMLERQVEMQEELIDELDVIIDKANTMRDFLKHMNKKFESVNFEEFLVPDNED